MRAYVITDKTEMADDVENTTQIVGVVSSKRHAIDACNEFLGRTGEQGVITWETKDKHTGCAIKGDHTVTYEMFFVNKVEE